MPFTVESEHRLDHLIMTLAGDLDSLAAPQLKEELDRQAEAAAGLQGLVLQCENLLYMASGGVRVLFYVKQRLFPGVRIYVVAAKPMVLDTLKRTGADKDFFIADASPLPDR